MNKYVFPGADASLPLGWVITQVCFLISLRSLELSASSDTPSTLLRYAKTLSKHGETQS